MHDLRNTDEENVQEQAPRSRADGQWKHDRYDERAQRPKTRRELVNRYGYDIRHEGQAENGRAGVEEQEDTPKVAKNLVGQADRAGGRNTDGAVPPRGSRGGRGTPRGASFGGGRDGGRGGGYSSRAPPPPQQHYQDERYDNRRTMQQDESVRRPGGYRGGRGRGDHQSGMNSHRGGHAGFRVFRNSPANARGGMMMGGRRNIDNQQQRQYTRGGGGGDDYVRDDNNRRGRGGGGGGRNSTGAPPPVVGRGAQQQYSGGKRYSSQRLATNYAPATAEHQQQQQPVPPAAPPVAAVPQLPPPPPPQPTTQRPAAPIPIPPPTEWHPPASFPAPPPTASAPPPPLAVPPPAPPVPNFRSSDIVYFDPQPQQLYRNPIPPRAKKRLEIVPPYQAGKGSG
ncbi:unnamed protein product [Gongylonema pulchrum]|uniref:Btz domain-containing protein n=1 Tax=Gongylonema pulchrum TaxID=637853 RepID=A0A183DSP9_9BILA|nr:unnamed protein product [Gongylonema pulchrum]